VATRPLTFQQARLRRSRRSRNLRRRQRRQHNNPPFQGNWEEDAVRETHCLTCHFTHNDNPWDCFTFPGLNSDTCRHCNSQWDYNFDPIQVNPLLSFVDNPSLLLIHKPLLLVGQFFKDLEYKSYIVKKLVDLALLLLALLLIRYL
jgi:hypothetical protein